MSQVPMTVPTSPTTSAPVTIADPAVEPHPHAPAPVQPLPAPVLTPASPDPTQAAILHALGAMAEQLTRMNNPPVPIVPVTPPSPPSPAEPVIPELVTIRREKAELLKLREELQHEANGQDPGTDDNIKVKTSEPAGVAVPDDAMLPFLTNPPSRPAVQVAFDLGPGGTHFKRFHEITTHDCWLSLIFDTRYEADQFIPPVTPPEGKPITISFPQNPDKTIKAIVPQGCHMRIGCMDIINFLIVKQEQPDVPAYQAPEATYDQQPTI